MLTSVAVTRRRLPDRRTLPSSTALTLSFFRISLISEARSLNLNADVLRGDVQSGHLRQAGDDVLRDAVAEVVLVRVCAEVGERENGDRRLGNFPSLASRGVVPPPAGAPAPRC